MGHTGTVIQTEKVIWLQEERVDVCLGKEKAFGEKVRENGQAVLLLWRGAFPAVVVGRSQVIEQEVNEEACAALDIPIFRRVSGGGAVLQTSGVYNYSLLLPERFKYQNRISLGDRVHSGNSTAFRSGERGSGSF